VMKFGGVAVADGQRMKRVGELVRRFKDETHEIVVVTSALSGVTDSLLRNAERIATETKTELVEEFIEELRRRHERAAEEAINDKNVLNGVIYELERRLGDLEKALTGICLLGELTRRSLDYIASFGERLSAPILSGVLESLGISSVHLTGGEAGIITNDDFGNAQPVDGVETIIAERILPLLRENKVPVVAGYIGETKDGIVTTLGRGGSDYTATIIGAAIKADEIWLWKDTEGIMTADPKIVPNARKIPTLSYVEAMELSYFGASILHPRAMLPVIRNETPVRVKNLCNPEDEGTLIWKEPERDRVVKAITLIKDAAIINVAGTGITSISDVAARVFSSLAAKNVNIIMVSQGSSERTISIVVDGSQLREALDALREIDGNVIRDFYFNPDVCVVGVVGAGMAGTPGVAGRVFSALGERGISIIMIAQGSSEYNISFVVRKDDAYEAVRAIHEAFGLAG